MVTPTRFEQSLTAASAVGCHAADRPLTHRLQCAAFANARTRANKKAAARIAAATDAKVCGEATAPVAHALQEQLPPPLRSTPCADTAPRSSQLKSQVAAFAAYGVVYAPEL